MFSSRQNLGSNPPTRDVGGLNHRLEIFGKVFQNRSELTCFKEPRGTFILNEHRDLWPERDLAGLLRQSKGSSQCCEFAIDRRSRSPLLAAPVDVARYPIVGDL